MQLWFNFLKFFWCSASTKATFQTVFLRYTAELSWYRCHTVTGLNTKKFGHMPMADNHYGTVRSPNIYWCKMPQKCPTSCNTKHHWGFDCHHRWGVDVLHGKYSQDELLRHLAAHLQSLLVEPSTFLYLDHAPHQWLRTSIWRHMDM